MAHNAKNGVFKIHGNMALAIGQKTIAGMGKNRVISHMEPGVTLWIRRQDGNIVQSGDALIVIQVTIIPAAGRISIN